VRSRREVQRWLSPSNVADDLKKHIEDCMPGSCDWLLEPLYLQKFISSPRPTLGHVQGPPGAGKSTASGFLINNLLSHKNSIVLYFFCKANDVEKRQPIHVLRTMLSQLLRADERLYPVVSEIYTQSGRPIADSYTEIEAALAMAFENIKGSEIFIIIDALDECQNVPKLQDSISKCMQSGQHTTRVLITSRPMALSFEANHNIRIDNVQGTDAFIKTYISRRVNANNNLKGSNLGDRVISEVSRAADGLWLYARLMMDEIERLASGTLVERQLQRIPRGLTEIYTQILQTSGQNFSPEQSKFAQHIFLWLDVKDYLPGFLVTGYEGLSLNTLSLILQYVNSGEPVFNPIALAREICSPLIKIREVLLPGYESRFSSATDGSLVLPRDLELDYVHHSAKQYILESFTTCPEGLPLVLRPRKFRYFYRAAVGVWYFADCSESESSLRSLRSNSSEKWNQSYFDMAYGIWGVLKLSEFETNIPAEELPELTSTVREVTEFISSTRCLRWIEAAIIINYSARYHHLLMNAIEALDATWRSNTNEMPLWTEYQTARLRFLEFYVYILHITGPQIPWSDLKLPKPARFDEDPLACEILKLGHKYSQNW
jgi:hypothetical protein